jgi:hypothetical protein
VLQHWTTLTPDGRRLVVTREGGVWGVACGDGDEARSELLDVALIEAIRRNGDPPNHSDKADYASWTRALADRFAREADQLDKRRSSELLPNRGDRIELSERWFGLPIRGTVQHVDQMQILVKWDDHRARSLRVGIDRFRIIS